MPTEELIRYGTLAYKFVHYAWETNLSLRQHRIYKTAVEVPSEVREIFPAETYKRARLYGLDSNRFAMCKELYNLILTTTATWWLDGIRYLWEYAGAVVRAFDFQQTEIIQSAAFVFLINTLCSLSQLPVNFYKYFVLEEKYGFNRRTIKFFVVDEIKLFVLLQAISMPFASALVYVIKAGGDYFFMYMWLFTVAVILFGITIYPGYIAPLFDKYTPLPDGELKTRIEELAESVQFPVYRIYVVEGSQRSAHSNAYFYGFYKNKRIVLFDTLLKDYTPTTGSTGEQKGCDNDEVLGILAHELGHWKHKHLLKRMAIFNANLLLWSLGCCVLFKYDALYHAFGFKKEKPALVGLLIIVLLVFSPYNTLIKFYMTCLTRRSEFQADAFAKSLGQGAHLRRALIKLGKNNLAFPIYDWLYSMWNHSHPPLIERLKALDKED